MDPGASVSGLYFSKPEAKYFGVGQIGHDQVVDYAARRGESLPVVEKRLAPNLDYNVSCDQTSGREDLNLRPVAAATALRQLVNFLPTSPSLVISLALYCLEPPGKAFLSHY